MGREVFLSQLGPLRLSDCGEDLFYEGKMAIFEKSDSAHREK